MSDKHIPTTQTPAERVHAALSAHPSLKRVVKAASGPGGLSRLSLCDQISLKSLRALRLALSDKALSLHVPSILIGRLDDQLVLSFPTKQREAATESTHGGSVEDAQNTSSGSARKQARAKRSRSDSALDLARMTVRRLSGMKEATKTGRGKATAADAAQNVVAALVALRTSDGAVPLESYAVSRRPAGSWGAEPFEASNAAKGGKADSENSSPPLPPAEDRVLVAARMTQGVGLPLHEVCAALQECEDGMVTIDEGMLDATFTLPHSASAAQAQTASMILVGVPRGLSSAPST